MDEIYALFICRGLTPNELPTKGSGFEQKTWAKVVTLAERTGRKETIQPDKKIGHIMAEWLTDNIDP
jgi:hypothetical protein